MAKQNDDEVRRRLMREAAEEALAEAADAYPDVAKWLDDDFDKGFGEIIGMSPEKLREELRKAIPDVSERDIREAQQAIVDAKKAAKGGWLNKPNPLEAERILMGVRGIREVKARKEEKSCFLALLLVVSGGLATAVGLAYGAAQAVAAVLT